MLGNLKFILQLFHSILLLDDGADEAFKFGAQQILF